VRSARHPSGSMCYMPEPPNVVKFRGNHMPRQLSCFVLVLVMVATSLIGALNAPGSARSASNDTTFTAAETVLAKSGNQGQWTFSEPPGSPPVRCSYPTDVTTGRSVFTPGPIVFARSGFSSQDITVRFSVNRRLPDGSLSPLVAGTTTLSATPSVPAVFFGRSSGPGDIGSTLVATVKLTWMNVTVEDGSVTLLYNQYQTFVEGNPDPLPVTDACYPARSASATLDPAEGTVGSSVHFHIFRFPDDPNVGIYFDGRKIGSVATSDFGNATGDFIVPAVQMGEHTVRFYRFGRSATKTFTVIPRIKVTPSTNVKRGQIVNVSLRGYAARETVRIRWKQGSVFTEIAHVTTSSTGSPNLDVHVPSFAVIGTNSVRGDGTHGRAQTNAVTVVGSSSIGSVTKVSPTPTKTASPKPTATSAPITPTLPPTATPRPSSTATAQPTELSATATTSSAEPSVTETATPEPSATATQETDPAEEGPNPTATPQAEETALPTETAVPPS
jgi:hypothetical protein